MSYVEKVLLPEERVLYITTVHWIIYIPGLLLTVGGGLLGFYSMNILGGMFGDAMARSMNKYLAGFALLIILGGIVMLARAYVRQISTELAVTSRRVIAKYGFISRSSFEIMINRITGANFEQTILGRCIGCGTILVHGTGGDVSPFDQIANPEPFHKALISVLDHRGGPQNSGGIDP
ncbi:MAG: PH domain-containing protein [Alphaproteobacteria bacterium]|nr:PH domain-containing protein [Alphaproteobacteria bacterium]